jgi:rSAM/selenodomain-associated transferase 2
MQSDRAQDRIDSSGDRQTPAPSIGIVLPVLDEAAILEPALDSLAAVAHDCPVVVVDGGSRDRTLAIARTRFPTERCEAARRGAQMNRGAARLSTDVLLFLHADSRLPAGFAGDIRRTLRDPSVAAGCFRLSFDHQHPMLRFYGWCTRFPGRFLHFGDQGFFVRREVFERMGGYRDLPFLEDVDLLRRLRRFGRFAVVPRPVTTSARRFLRRGIVRQQLVNFLVVVLFELGVPARRLASLYPHVR